MKVLPIFRPYQKILKRFVSFCISLIFTYCLFVGKNWWRLKSSFLIFFFAGGGGVKICDKMAISAYIFEKSRKGPIFKASS